MPCFYIVRSPRPALLFAAGLKPFPHPRSTEQSASNPSPSLPYVGDTSVAFQAYWYPSLATLLMHRLMRSVVCPAVMAPYLDASASTARAGVSRGVLAGIQIISAPADVAPPSVPAAEATDGCRKPALCPREGRLGLVQREASFARSHVSVGHGRTGGRGSGATAGSQQRRWSVLPVLSVRFALDSTGDARAVTVGAGGMICGMDRGGSGPRKVGRGCCGSFPGVGFAVNEAQRSRHVLRGQPAPQLGNMQGTEAGTRSVC